LARLLAASALDGRNESGYPHAEHGGDATEASQQNQGDRNGKQHLAFSFTEMADTPPAGYL
jgi:hypothetical protein